MADGASPLNQPQSLADLRAKATVNTLGRANGTPTAPDPIAESLAVRRQILAAKLMEQSSTEQSTSTIQAENARIKAEIENAQLREQVTKQGSGEAWQQYVFEQMQRAEAKVDEAIAGRAEAERALLQEQLRMLQVELERTRSNAPANPFTMVAETIDQAQAIVDKLHPRQPESAHPTQPAAIDPGLRKWELMMAQQREERAIERADRSEERTLEFQLKNRQLDEELAIKRESAAAQARFFEDGLPKLLALGQQIFGALTQQQVAMPASPSVAGGPGVAPAAGPPAAPAATQPEVPLPPGVAQMACQNCGARILYKETYLGVVCWRCGAEYTAGPSPSDPAHETEVQTRDEVAAAPDEPGSGRSTATEADDGGLDDRAGAGVHSGT